METIKPKKSKVYISGKITGLIHEEAFNLFEEAEKLITNKLSFEVINPMKLMHNHDKSWENYMKEDLQALLNCDYIFKLDNWKFSKGARLEVLLAEELNIISLNNCDDLMKKIGKI